MPDEIARAGDEVGVDVRFRDVGDAELLVRGRGQVAARGRGAGSIDQRLARAFRSDQVARLREALVVEAFQKHGRIYRQTGQRERAEGRG